MNYKYAFFTTLLVSGVIAWRYEVHRHRKSRALPPTAMIFMSWLRTRWMAK